MEKGEIADVWVRSPVSMAFAICQSNLCNACSPFADCKRYVIMRRIAKEVVMLRLEPILAQLFLFSVLGLASNAILVVLFCFVLFFLENRAH